jgi:CheY-like chemotaxis protein
MKAARVWMPGVLLMEETAVLPRALVVESRADVALSVSAAIADADLEAMVVTDGPAAVAAVETWAPAVVLIDLTLPPLDGWYVLAALGDLPERPLLVVRVADPNEVERAIALGADAWVDDDVHLVAAAGRLGIGIAA